MAAKDTPPPIIGKAGRYTVFITPPATPNPSPRPKLTPVQSPLSPPVQSPATPVQHPPPPVQVPPPQFEKSGGKSTGVLGFFWAAVAKVQNAHSSLDEYLADWLGLDQSRYQWALNDYYENNGKDKDGVKPKEVVSKGQAV